MADVIQDFSLINEAYFKSMGPIPKNYDITELKPYFKVAEELWVVPVIGAPLYDELLQQVNDNQVTELNSTLLLKIYAYEAIAIVYESLPFCSYHISEVGITKGKSENSDSVSINDVNFISSHLRNQLELLKKYLKKFLDDNADLYPLYKGDGNPCDCHCENNDERIWWDFFFNGGTLNKYDMERFYLGCLAKKHKPNPYIQAYTTRRRSIDIV